MMSMDEIDKKIKLLTKELNTLKRIKRSSIIKDYLALEVKDGSSRDSKDIKA